MKPVAPPERNRSPEEHLGSAAPAKAPAEAVVQAEARATGRFFIKIGEPQAHPDSLWSRLVTLVITSRFVSDGSPEKHVHRRSPSVLLAHAVMPQLYRRCRR
jgi:hypothetical protein